MFKKVIYTTILNLMLCCLLIVGILLYFLPAPCFSIISEEDTTNIQSDSLSGNNKSEQKSLLLVPLETSKFEFLPILSYDTDVGFGYGIKTFFLNYLGLNESFDITLFNSTKGERWYRAVFSLPDFELRQGKIYPIAFDVVIDYDKWIKSSFFGIGYSSSFTNREYYTREPFEVIVACSRGFTRTFAGQIGVRLKSIRNFNFEDSSRLKALPPVVNCSTAKYFSLFISLRYDTRNSFINPSNGVVIQTEIENSPQFGFTNVAFTRFSFAFQYYRSLLHPKIIFASRIKLQSLIGNDLPVQVLLPIGGNQTLRGFPQDRFLDKISTVVNCELRLPIYWQFGGIAGIDLGRVWHKLSELGFDNWAINPTIGLRFYMDTFIVRLDIGFGKETTGFYFNFGHIF